MKACKEELKAQNVGNALYGLQGMSSEVAEVRAMLAALVPQVKACKEEFKAQNVGNTLYGLQGMSIEVSEVQAMLAALVPQVKACKEEFSAQEVGNALYGLQGMSSEVPVVEEILALLFENFDISKVGFTAQNIGNALYGLKNMHASYFADALVSHLLIRDKIDSTLYDDLDSFTSLVVALNSLLQSDTYSKASWMDKVETLLAKLTRELERRPCPVTTSKSEKRIAIVAERMSWDTKDPLSVVVSSNTWLHGFEADIVLTVSKKNLTLQPQNATSSEILAIINVEVDGSYHRRMKKKSFCKVRDERMRREGIRVVRWDIVDMEHYGCMKSADIEKMLLAEVQKSLQSLPSSIE